MKKILLLLSLFFLPSIPVKAHDINYEDYIYVSGETIGIKMDTSLQVVGTFPVRYKGELHKPWQDKIREGDKIVSINDTNILSTNDITNLLNETKGTELKIKFIRDNKVNETKITPSLKDDGTYSLGLYIKDNLMGVGTLTYVIPDVNIFGALGHSIDADFIKGSIYQSNVIGIKKSRKNDVGEKEVKILEEELGEIQKNSTTGIHGEFSNLDFSNMKKYQIGSKENVHKGKASILTSLDNKTIEEFDIEITEVKKQDKKDVKSFKYTITDTSLIDRCGGIIQGMSGSPIIQDGKIIGAVTHVVVNNVLEGYGIYIEWMLNDMDVFIS